MDKAAFDVLYQTHYRRVLGLCRKMLGRAADAEDATQEVFMRGFRNFSRYRTRDPFGPWINTIASNYCVDVLRREQRLDRVFRREAESPEPVSPLSNGSDQLISAHEAKVINRAVEALPEQYRLPIVLAYYAEASYEEIAGTLGITTSHVGVLLLRGRRKLRAALATDAAEPHGHGKEN